MRGAGRQGAEHEAEKGMGRKDTEEHPLVKENCP